MRLRRGDARPMYDEKMKEFADREAEIRNQMDEKAATVDYQDPGLSEIVVDNLYYDFMAAVVQLGLVPLGAAA